MQDPKWGEYYHDPEKPRPAVSSVIRPPNDKAIKPRPRKEKEPSSFSLEDPLIDLEFPGVTFSPPTKLVTPPDSGKEISLNVVIQTGVEDFFYDIVTAEPSTTNARRTKEV